MAKTTKVLILILEITLLIVFTICKKYLYSLFFLMIFGYSLYLFFKWKRVKPTNNFDLRSYIVLDIVLLLFLISLFRILQLQIFNSERYRIAIQRQSNIEIKKNGSRGKIYDATEKELAYNIDSYSIVIDPKALMEFPEGKLFLYEMLENNYIKGNKKEVLKKIKDLAKNNKRYRRLNEITVREKENVVKLMKKYSLTYQGIIRLEEIKNRKYYDSSVYGPIVGNIGFKDKDEKEGIFGLELYYEKYLKGLKKSMRVPIVRGLKMVLPTADIDTKINLDGNDLYLTLDSDLSYIFNSEMKKQFEVTKSEEAYGIIMDPNSGRILATSFYQKNKKNMTNPIFQSLLEPGSIFKPMIVAAALESQKATPETVFDIGEGKYEKYGYTISEGSKSLKGELSVVDILKRSSNVGMVLISENFSDVEFDDWLKKYGLYEKTGVDFPYEQKSRYVPPNKWNGLKKSNMAFGQGIAVTPIQILTAFSAVINGGYIYKPYLVEKIVDKDGIVIRRNTPKVERRVLSEKTSEKMKKMMELAVLDGTVKKAQVEGYRVGGKTGTAQYSENGRYVKNEYLSSAIVFFPVENPQYVMLAMFFKPQSEKQTEKYGGSAAAPVLGRIIRRITKLKNIYSQDIKNITVNTRNKNFKNILTLRNSKVEIMPDIKGMTAKEVIELFKKTDIDIKIKGVGVVIKQFPEAGTSLTGVKEIKIELREG